MRRRAARCASRGALRRTRLAFVLVLALVARGRRAAKAKEHELQHRGAALQPVALRILHAEQALPPPRPPPHPRPGRARPPRPGPGPAPPAGRPHAAPHRRPRPAPPPPAPPTPRPPP